MALVRLLRAFDIVRCEESTPDKLIINPTSIMITPRNKLFAPREEDIMHLIGKESVQHT